MRAELPLRQESAPEILGGAGVLRIRGNTIRESRACQTPLTLLEKRDRLVHPAGPRRKRDGGRENERQKA